MMEDITRDNVGSLGTANRALFHGPGTNNWDLSLRKTPA